jgi:hypothetical protein
MKEHLQIFDSKKFLRIMLGGLICYLLSFVITLINIKSWGFFVFLLVPNILIILFFPVGLYYSKVKIWIEINSGLYAVDNCKFRINDIDSYEIVSIGNTQRLNIRLKNRDKISLAIRDSYPDKDKFKSIVEKIINDIYDYNSQTDSQKIFEYDFYKTKNAKIVGVLFIIFDLVMTYLIIFNDSKRVPIYMKYLGVVMINVMIFSYVYGTFRRE